jgi:hypothetical protein
VTPLEAKAIVEMLVPTCKALGVRTLRVGDIQIELAPPNTGTVDETVLQKFADLVNKGMPSDEETLFWSAPGGPAPRPPEEAPFTPPKTARGRRG